MNDVLGLEKHYQTVKSSLPDSLRLRSHRALSWFTKASTIEDLDSRFIFLWIGFNALYAKRIDFSSSGDKQQFRAFIARICKLDDTGRIYKLIWQHYTGSIRILLDNPYVFEPFWRHHNGEISGAAWQEDFAKAKKKVGSALKAQDTETILRVLFNRLYTLRNQIIHGGATYASSVNRDQLKDSCAILGELLPVMFRIIISNHDKDWGKPYYPVVD